MMNPINAIKQHLLPLELTGSRDGAIIRYMQDALSPLCDELTTVPWETCSQLSEETRLVKLLVTAHSGQSVSWLGP